MSTKALGIDLGTSNCCVAIYENGKPRVLADERGNNTTPSYLTVLANEKFLVGHLAKVQVISNPYQTAYAVKRLMGRNTNDPNVKLMKENVGYEIVSGKDQSASVKLGDRVFSPEEISATYLKCMRDIAHFQMQGEDLKDAIITVPAYFNDAQRKATKEAGELAGLNVLRLINEPTAAALAYGFRRNMDKRIVIYDLGGGTFDISVLEISGGVFEVMGTHGDCFLGGHDFDNRLVNLVVEDFKKKYSVDLRLDKMALQRVKDACEHAKCELSASEKAQINLPFIASGKEGTLNLAFEITRKVFQELTKDLVERSMSICKQVLKDCNVKTTEIDDIVLVGGQSRMPAVQQAVAAFFGKPPVKGVHPDEAIAVGAAIQAGILEDQSKDVLLLDVTPLSLGIQSSGDIFAPILEKNTKVPVSISKIFTTMSDDQSRVKIAILQGESKKASENFSLGEFILEGITPAPRMEPKIQVTFRIDVDGILNVKAMDMESKEAKQITIRNLSGKEGKPETIESTGQMLSKEAEESLELVERK